jgi:hypothetical protein
MNELKQKFVRELSVMEGVSESLRDCFSLEQAAKFLIFSEKVGAASFVIQIAVQDQ